MTPPPIVPARPLDPIIEALMGDRIVVLPGDDGYLMAAAAGRSAADRSAAQAIASRPADFAPSFIVGRKDQARGLAAEWTQQTSRVTDRMWPGPLFVIVPAEPELGQVIGLAAPVVQIGLPADRILRRLGRTCGPLIVAPLRGPGGRPITTAVEAADQSDAGDVVLIVEGGSRIGPGPTVLDCTVTPPAVRVVGALPESYIDAVLMMANRHRRWFRAANGSANGTGTGTGDS